MLHSFSKHKIILLSFLFAVTAVTWLCVRALPATEEDIRRSACLVEGNSFLCLVSGNDTVALTADSVSQEGVWINRHWWWPSCDGRVLSVRHGRDPLPAGALSNPDSLRRLLSAGTDSLGRLLKRKETERLELQYYLRSHGVIDEGYTQIAAYANAQGIETDSLKRRYDKLTKINPGKGLSLIRKGIYRVSWYGSSGKLQTVACEPVVTDPGHDGGPIIIHTRRSIKPWGVYAVRNSPWGVASHRKIIDVTLSPSDTITPYHAILSMGNYDDHQHDLPRLFARDGSPVFTQHGRFIGVIEGRRVRK